MTRAAGRQGGVYCPAELAAGGWLIWGQTGAQRDVFTEGMSSINASVVNDDKASKLLCDEHVVDKAFWLQILSVAQMQIFKFVRFFLEI